jgi:hypothetical protein
LISQNTTVLLDTDIFWGSPIDANDLQLRYKRCRTRCETDSSSNIYADCGTRLCTWVLSILILVGIHNHNLAIRYSVLK